MPRETRNYAHSKWSFINNILKLSIWTAVLSSILIFNCHCLRINVKQFYTSASSQMHQFYYTRKLTMINNISHMGSNKSHSWYRLLLIYLWTDFLFILWWYLMTAPMAKTCCMYRTGQCLDEHPRQLLMH